MRILVVDDDVELVGLLEFALQGAGYEVVSAFDGEQALAQFARHAPELVVLDVNLPRRDGFSVLQALRKDSEVPVMMLTVRAAEEDEVRGLDLGADDYLRKPFSPRALLARVRALLRRGSEGEGEAPLLSSGALTLDPERNEMRIAQGEVARLSTLELRLLRLLMNHRGHPVHPDRIIGFVWSDRDSGDREALKQLVHRLRHKLVRIGGSGDWIEHIPNAGYALVNERLA